MHGIIYNFGMQVMKRESPFWLAGWFFFSRFGIGASKHFTIAIDILLLNIDEQLYKTIFKIRTMQCGQQTHLGSMVYTLDFVSDKYASMKVTREWLFDTLIT